MHIKKYLAAFLCISAFYSCEVINPDEEVPAYIAIDTTFFQAQYDTAGTARQKITDVWVYVNSQALGVYELPAAFPVLAKGEAKILITPGIMSNGISITRQDYPFFTSFDTSVNLTVADTTYIRPLFKYAKGVTFAFMEDFEGSIDFTTTKGFEAIEKTTDPAKVLEGGVSGELLLDQSDTIFQAESDVFTINNKENVFLELHYKASHEFEVGLIGTEEVPHVTITPKSSWNKIYINFSQLAKAMPTKEFKVFFKVEKPDSIESAQFYFDNIKVTF